MGNRIVGSVIGCALVLATGACGGDDDDGDDGDDGGDGTTSDASLPDASAPDASAPDASPPDASPPDASPPDGGGPVDAGVDAGPEGIAIDAVATADGDTQVRQGGAVDLVITGRELGEVDTVLVGDLDGTVLSASPGEVRVDFFVPHGTSPGPRTVTVSGPGGSASLTDALELTFYIVAADGTEGGRGTYQSPLSLCGVAVAAPLLGDTVSLLAGEHVCDPPDGFPIGLPGGVTVAGAGSDVTVVRGGAASFSGFSMGTEPNFPSAFRGLTIEAPDPFDGSLLLAGLLTLEVEDIVLEGPGIVVQQGSVVTMNITGLRQIGPGIGIDGRGRMDLTMTASSFSDCGTGLFVSSGAAAVSDTVFERCGLGVRGGVVANVFPLPSVTITGCEFLDDQVGVTVGLGYTTVVDSIFRDLAVTTQTSQIGAQVTHGFLSVAGCEMTDMGQYGVLAAGSGATEGFAYAFVGGTTINGGPIGIEVSGFPDDEVFALRNSVVRDQTVAAVRVVADGTFAMINLGDGGQPGGGNELSVASGVALLDARLDPSPDGELIDCTGITLNGRTYSGLVQGPAASLPDYQMVSNGFLQF